MENDNGKGSETHSGVYVVRLNSPAFEKSIKVVLIK